MSFAPSSTRPPFTHSTGPALAHGLCLWRHSVHSGELSEALAGHTQLFSRLWSALSLGTSLTLLPLPVLMVIVGL